MRRNRPPDHAFALIFRPLNRDKPEGSTLFRSARKRTVDSTVNPDQLHRRFLSPFSALCQDLIKQRLVRCLFISAEGLDTTKLDKELKREAIVVGALLLCLAHRRTISHDIGRS